MRPFACLFACAWLMSAAAWAQVDLVDPDAKPRRAEPRAVQPAEAEPEALVADDPADGDLVAPPTERERRGTAAPGSGAPAPGRGAGPPVKGGPVEPKKEAPKKEPPPVVVQAISDADLDAAWRAWREANASKDAQAEGRARKRLLELRGLIGASNIDSWAVGLLRAAQAWETAGDSGAAVEIAVSASELAPDLPATWFLLTRLYLVGDPSGVGRYLDALRKGLLAQLRDPRYLRPMVVDVAATTSIALVATAIVVLVVLLLRRGAYFLYDFHFLFPRAAARWQTGAIAVLLLSLPVVFRMGVAPTLLACFAAVTLYLTVAERVVATVLIGLLGLVPLAGALVVEQTAFAETTAEDLFAIDRGGPGLEPLVRRYEQLAASDKVGFAERYVLGNHHLNRGHLEPAVAALKAALTLRPDDVPSRVALAKTLFLQGDLENSRSILEAVKASSPSAVVLLDLSRVYSRRVQVYGEASTGEVDKANSNLMEARTLDPSLPSIDEAEPLAKELLGNTFLRTLPLPRAELLALAHGEVAAARVKSQLSSLLVGSVPGPVAPLFPLGVALLLLAFGFLDRALGAARVCNRCGRPVSRRGDPDVSAGSQLCTQCVNVFARKNVVDPSVKVRKQLEVARYESRVERAATVLGVAWSGMGHVFSGAPVRGALYGFAFVLAITGAVLRAGVLRPPFEGMPVALRLVPLALLFLAVYPLSLLRLRRKGS